LRLIAALVGCALRVAAADAVRGRADAGPAAAVLAVADHLFTGLAVGERAAAELGVGRRGRAGGGGRTVRGRRAARALVDGAAVARLTDDDRLDALAAIGEGQRAGGGHGVAAALG